MIERKRANGQIQRATEFDSVAVCDQPSRNNTLNIQPLRSPSGLINAVWPYAGHKSTVSKSVALTIKLPVQPLVVQLRFAKIFWISIVAKMSLRSYGVSYVLRSLFCVNSSTIEG